MERVARLIQRCIFRQGQGIVFQRIIDTNTIRTDNIRHQRIVYRERVEAVGSHPVSTTDILHLTDELIGNRATDILHVVRGSRRVRRLVVGTVCIRVRRSAISAHLPQIFEPVRVTAAWQGTLIDS